MTDQLRKDILSGHFPPATRIVELQLTERYETGRATVRSAIVELTKEGLLVREANRGATVRSFSPTERVENYEARAAIECLIARRASERGLPEERAELASLLSKMHEAAREDQPEKFAEMGLALNVYIRAMARHSVAEALIAAMVNITYQVSPPLSTYWDQRVKFAEEANAIVEAVIRNDPDGAERAVRAHYATIIEVLR